MKLVNNASLIIQGFLISNVEDHPGSTMRPLVNDGDLIIETFLTINSDEGHTDSRPQ